MFYKVISIDQSLTPQQVALRKIEIDLEELLAKYSPELSSHEDFNTISNLFIQYLDVRYNFIARDKPVNIVNNIISLYKDIRGLSGVSFFTFWEMNLEENQKAPRRYALNAADRIHITALEQLDQLHALFEEPYKHSLGVLGVSIQFDHGSDSAPKKISILYGAKGIMTPDKMFSLDHVRLMSFKDSMFKQRAYLKNIVHWIKEFTSIPRDLVLHIAQCIKFAHFSSLKQEHWQYLERFLSGSTELLSIDTLRELHAQVMEARAKQSWQNDVIGFDDALIDAMLNNDNTRFKKVQKDFLLNIIYEKWYLRDQGSEQAD